jgi:rare lipoprotein A
MPTTRTSDGSGRKETSGGASAFFPDRIRKIAATILIGAALFFAGGERCAAQSPEGALKKPRGKVGYAVWYVVPANSLARRRAAKGEYTAAHNHLPLGAMVRVTHLANGKSVIVRITDRGITDKRFMIDLCKEAAAELGMLSEGTARVRIEELPDDKRVGADPAPDSKASAAHP